MAEQIEQSYQAFEDRNQNSACLLPGKIDLMDPNDNGLLSYDDNGENENVDTSDLLLHEKQFSEISSASEMSTSNSNDTGFGSAAVSEITTPVDTNYTVANPLTENAELTAKDESSDSASVQTNNQKQILPNDQANWENSAVTGHKEEENSAITGHKVEENSAITGHKVEENSAITGHKVEENSAITGHKAEDNANEEKVANNTIQDDSVELAEQKNEEHNNIEQFSDRKAGESVVKITHNEEESKHIEETEQTKTENVTVNETAEQEHQETKIESVEKTPQLETGDESFKEIVLQETGEIIEKIVQEESEDKTVKKIEQQENENVEKIDNESFEQTAQQETGYESSEQTAQQETGYGSSEQTAQQETGYESSERTSFKENNWENVHHSATEDENSEKLVNGKAEEEHASSKETRHTSVAEEASYKGQDVSIEKITGDILESDLEKVKQEVLKTKSAEPDVPEDRHGVEVEETKSDYEHDERETHRPAQDGNICKTGDDNIEKTSAENEDVINASLNKVVEGNASNANNNLAESENIEKVKCKLAEGDHNILNAKNDKPEDTNTEDGKVNKTGEEDVLTHSRVSDDILTHSRVSDEVVADVKVDKPHDENESSNNTESNNPQEDVCSKVDHQNLQHAESDKEDEQAADEQKENVMDILGNGFLLKKVLVPGKGVDTRPTSGEVVTVKVDGQLPDGTHVDTGEITFNLNDGDVILAFDLAVALMEVGEKCELFTSERYAYGSLGRDPDIPKDTSITYILELVSVQKSPVVSELSYDQRLKMGEDKRERGNYLFGRGDYSGAINSYNRAVKLLDNPELNEKVDESCRGILTESSVKCYNNLAASQLKIEALDAAIKSCERVLSVQVDNVKALFRLGKAYGAKGDVDQALVHLRRAVRLDPESKLMQQEMLNLTRRKNKEAATEKELYQRMLGVKPGAKPATEEDNKRSNSNKLVKWTLLAGGVAAVLISVGLSWYRSS